MNEKRGFGFDYRWLAYCVLTVAFMAAGIVLAFQPTLLSGFARLQTDPGDSRLNNYILEHLWRWLHGVPLHTSLWDPPFFYPSRNVLAYTDTLLSLAPLYWLWRAVGFAPEISFTWWMITLCVLNYLLALLLLRRLAGVGWVAANFGAYLIAFGSSRIAQLGHQQLLCHAYTLLAIVCLAAIFAPDSASQSSFKRQAWILAFFACFTAQFYAGYYYGYFLFLVLLIAGIWGVALGRFRGTLLDSLKLDWPAWLSGTAAAALLLAPLAYHYLLVARALGFWSLKVGQAGLPRLASYLWLGGDNWLYGWLANFRPFTDLPLAGEQQIGLGIATTLVLLWFLWRHRHDRWVLLIMLIMVTAFFAFTMFPARQRLWNLWYYTLPGIQGIRVMARMGILLLIPAGIALSVFIHRQRGRRGLLAAALLVGVLCCMEQARKSRYSYDRELYNRRVELIGEHISPDCEAVFLSEVAPDVEAWPGQLDIMWASMLRGVPTIGGYSGRFPDCWAVANPLIREPADFMRIGESLDDWCARHGIDRSRVCWLQLGLPRE